MEVSFPMQELPNPLAPARKSARRSDILPLPPPSYYFMQIIFNIKIPEPSGRDLTFREAMPKGHGATFPILQLASTDRFLKWKTEIGKSR